MTVRELSLLCMMALIWGAHFSVLKVSFGDTVDPLFYAAVRMTIVAIILSPLLRIHKGQMLRILIAGACFGGLNYAFMFSGLNLTNASVAAMTLELYAPIAMIFSVIFLKERIGWRRIVGMATAFAGVALIYSANSITSIGAAPLLGMTLLICTALCDATGAIILKKIDGVKPFQLLAWFAVVGAAILWVATALFETNQLSVLEEGRIWRFLPALMYSVFLASLIGQAAYYWLLSRLPVNQVASSTLLIAFLAVVFGVVFLREPVTWQLLVGGTMTLAGVGVILLRNNTRDPALAAPPDAGET